jgi:hypothetical protein
VVVDLVEEADSAAAALVEVVSAVAVPAAVFSIKIR